jgi:KaiC/GvpD/RAD55 family RecA-like ATPase
MLSSYSSFGVPEVDEILGGGLLPGCSYLLEIEPGSEELAFLVSFLEAGWRQNELCAVVTYDMPHEELIKRLSQFVNVRAKLDSGTFAIMDLWSEAKNDYQLNGPIFMTRNPGDINAMTRMSLELASRTSKRIQDGKFRGLRIATLSVSSMIMNYKFEQTYKWIKTGLDLTRRSNITTLGILSPKMFEETIIAAVEHFHDGIIVLNMKELGDKFQRYIRVKRSPISGFSTMIVPYEIVDNKPRLQKRLD